MPLCVNQSGTWREITTGCVNVSGTWRNLKTGRINESGTWRMFAFPPYLGDAYGGGYLIYKEPFYVGGPGVLIMVAPSSTEVSRCWNCRNHAITTAQANAACGDWFIPSISLLENPGYERRTYWDSYSPCAYLSNSASSNQACAFYFASGFNINTSRIAVRCVRAFRYVTY